MRFVLKDLLNCYYFVNFAHRKMLYRYGKLTNTSRPEVRRNRGKAADNQHKPKKQR